MPTPAPVSQVTVNHTEPWKEDGNIVLTAQGKYFRVHRSILSAHSELFKDMFDCPHPTEVEKEFIDSCPVIHLYDTADDVQIMLKAMYDRSYPLPYYKKVPITFVSAFLHLGEKYGIPALVKEARAKLCCNVEPSSLIAGSSLPVTDISKLFPVITDCDPYNFQLMNLLQEMGPKARLPIVMYQCIMTCPLRYIVDGYQDKGSFYSLSPANLRSFILMKDVLENCRVRVVKALCVLPACISPSCMHNKRQLCLEDIYDAPPFSSLLPRWDRLLCQNCKTSLKAKRETEMNRAWNQIPSAFGFDSWGEMRNSSDFSSFEIIQMIE